MSVCAQVPQIAAGLAALAHRSGDAEASQIAVEALCAMLDGVRSRCFHTYTKVLAY